jgi:hypothetical protein
VAGATVKKKPILTLASGVGGNTVPHVGHLSQMQYRMGYPPLIKVKRGGWSPHLLTQVRKRGNPRREGRKEKEEERKRKIERSGKEKNQEEERRQEE